MSDCPGYTSTRTYCDSLGNFEDPEKPERPEAAEPERPGPGLQVDPDDFEERSGDDGAVEPVERRLEVDRGPQGVQTDAHLEHKGAQEQELRVN